MKIEDAMRLFEKDADVAVFSASLDRSGRARVCVYPMKSGPGFLWIVWRTNLPNESTPIAGGVQRRKSVVEIAKSAVDRLYMHAAG
jgi:hypothetical protein